MPRKSRLESAARRTAIEIEAARRYLSARQRHSYRLCEERRVLKFLAASKSAIESWHPAEGTVAAYLRVTGLDPET